MIEFTFTNVLNSATLTIKAPASTTIELAYETLALNVKHPEAWFTKDHNPTGVTYNTISNTNPNLEGQYSIGEIHLYTESVENPYRTNENEPKELTYDKRKEAFDFLKENHALPPNVKYVWYAPGQGGAYAIDPATVRYVKGLIYAKKLSA